MWRIANEEHTPPSALSATHLASPHSLLLLAGLQIRMQRFLSPFAWKLQPALAVTPVGASLGHLSLMIAPVHSGAQIPRAPAEAESAGLTAFSSAPQPLAGFS
jgi:hypothetical protein